MNICPVSVGYIPNRSNQWHPAYRWLVTTRKHPQCGNTDLTISSAIGLSVRFIEVHSSVLLHFLVQFTLLPADCIKTCKPKKTACMNMCLTRGFSSIHIQMRQSYLFDIEYPESGSKGYYTMRADLLLGIPKQHRQSHYSDVIMGAVASQIPKVSIV